jgi:hypothetical protein
MKKIVAWLVCCTFASVLVADLLAQVVVICPKTKPNTRKCTPDRTCNSPEWGSTNCTDRYVITGLNGPFGSQSSTNDEESVVSITQKAPCQKLKRCIFFGVNCVPGNDPEIFSEHNVQEAVPCP